MARGYKKTTEDFYKEVDELTKGEYELTGEYVRYDIKVSITHLICGTTHKYTPGSFRNNPKCFTCFPRTSGTVSRKSNEHIQEMFDNISKGTFTVSGEYKSKASLLDVKHNICGKIFEMYPGAILDGSLRCPNCKGTSGEQAVEGFLIQNNINYVAQYSIGETRRRYDFYLPDTNQLIEFDGEQHFESVEHWGGADYLKEIQDVDEDKNLEAYHNGCSVLRIKYQGYTDLNRILEYQLLGEEEINIV